MSDFSTTFKKSYAACNSILVKMDPYPEFQQVAFYLLTRGLSDDQVEEILLNHLMEMMVKQMAMPLIKLFMKK